MLGHPTLEKGEAPLLFTNFNKKLEFLQRKDAYLEK